MKFLIGNYVKKFIIQIWETLLNNIETFHRRERICPQKMYKAFEKLGVSILFFFAFFTQIYLYKRRN